MLSLDERGKQCPIPIVETKKAIEPLGVGEVIETIVPTVRTVIATAVAILVMGTFNTTL